MKPGFLSACLPDVPLESLVPWAAEQGFQTIELAAWAPGPPERYQPRHVEAAALGRDEAERIRALFGEHGLSISSLAYYDNPLVPDAVLVYTLYALFWKSRSAN